MRPPCVLNMVVVCTYNRPRPATRVGHDTPYVSVITLTGVVVVLAVDKLSTK